jgi:hypothetical protein
LKAASTKTYTLFESSEGEEAVIDKKIIKKEKFHKNKEYATKKKRKIEESKEKLEANVVL